MQILFAIDMYVYTYILKHVFSIGNKSNVQLKPTNINVLYLDYYSKLLMPLGIHHAFILGYQYICHKKFCFCHFIAEGEFKKKIIFFSFLKPADDKTVLQLSTVLFCTIFLTFLRWLFSAISITCFIATLWRFSQLFKVIMFIFFVCFNTSWNFYLNIKYIRKEEKKSARQLKHTTGL